MKVSPIMTMMDYVQGYERGGVQYDFNIFLIHFGCRKSPDKSGVPLPDLLLVSPKQLLAGDVVFSLAGDVQQDPIHYSPLPTLAINRILSKMSHAINRTAPVHYDKLAEVFREMGHEAFKNPEIITLGRSTVRMFYELTARLLEGKINTKADWATAGLDIIEEIRKDKIAERREKLSDVKAGLRTAAHIEKVTGVPAEKPNKKEIVTGFAEGYSPLMRKVHNEVRQRLYVFKTFGITEMLLRKNDFLPEPILNSLAEEIGVKRTPGVDLELVRVINKQATVAASAVMSGR